MAIPLGAAALAACDRRPGGDGRREPRTDHLQPLRDRAAGSPALRVGAGRRGGPRQLPVLAQRSRSGLAAELGVDRAGGSSWRSILAVARAALRPAEPARTARCGPSLAVELLVIFAHSMLDAGPVRRRHRLGAGGDAGRHCPSGFGPPRWRVFWPASARPARAAPVARRGGITLIDVGEGVGAVLPVPAPRGSGTRPARRAPPTSSRPSQLKLDLAGRHRQAGGQRVDHLSESSAVTTRTLIVAASCRANREPLPRRRGSGIRATPAPAPPPAGQQASGASPPARTGSAMPRRRSAPASEE